MGMKISKTPAFLCAIFIGALCLTVRAEDNPAQAAARAALAKQLFDLSAQSPATNAPMQPANDQKAKAKAKAEKEKARQDATAAKAKAKQEAAELKAKQAAEKKRAEQEAAAAKANAAAKADQAAVQVKAKPSADQKADAERAALAAALAARMDAEAQAKAAQTPNSPATAVNAPVAAKVETPKPSEKAAQREEGYIGKDLGMKPIAAPTLPISATKEERLQALLAKYKADQISPEEYHKQRAAILAEP